MVLHYRNEDRRGVYAELEVYHGAGASAAVGCGSAWGSTTGGTIGGSGTEVGAGTGAGVGGLGGGGSTSAKNPGRNRSIRSCVAAHRAFCLESRVSFPGAGGTRRFVAFITNTTFFRDSGIASVYKKTKNQKSVMTTQDGNDGKRNYFFFVP